MSDDGTNSVVNLACVKEREEQDRIATNRTVEEAINIIHRNSHQLRSIVIDDLIKELEKLRRI